MKYNLKERAITLIALVITIVVLIILAAVAINLSLGNNGIFNRAKTAKEQYQNAQDYEETQIGKTVNDIDNYIDGNRDTVNNYYGMFIDTSNVLKTLTVNTEYEATEDCVIVGTIATYTNGEKRASVNVVLNNVTLFTIGNTHSEWWDNNELFLPMKKGQKIKLTTPGGTPLSDFNSTYMSINVKAYGIVTP